MLCVLPSAGVSSGTHIIPPVFGLDFAWRAKYTFMTQENITFSVTCVNSGSNVTLNSSQVGRKGAWCTD